MNKIDTSHTTVTIYTETGNLSFRGSSTKQGKPIDDLLSVNTRRDLGTDNSVFELQLVPRNQWFQRIRPNDLVIIEMNRKSKGKDEVFIGLVDDIRLNLTGNSNTTSITGRGFSKALANFEIGVLTQLQADTSVMNPIFQNILHQLPNGEISVVDIINHTFYEVFLKHEDYQFSNGSSYSTIVNTQLSCIPEATAIKMLNYAQYSGNYFNLLRELKGEPFHELFWEVYDSRPTMVFRPTPFDSDTWGSLPIKTIDVEDLVNISIGISDLETYTVFSLKYNGQELPLDRVIQEALAPPLYNPEYYKKYGLKALTVQVPYFRLMTSSVGNSMNSMKDLQQKLYDWYIKNNSMKNGSITIVGDPTIKVGTRLKLWDEEYYIESVNHKFVCGQSYTTELGITRGCTNDIRFGNPTGSCEEYSAEKILAISNGGFMQ